MLFDLFDGVLGTDFFEKSLNIVSGIAVPLLLFGVGFFLEGVFVSLVGNDTWILSSPVSILGLLHSVLDSFKELGSRTLQNTQELCNGFVN